MIADIGSGFEPSVSTWNSRADGSKAGGDWCDVIAISAETIALTIGDVSGHGTAAATAMNDMRSAVLRAIRDLHVPSEILALANETAFHEEGGKIVTAIVAFINYRRGTLTFANAGHPPPLLLTASHHAFLTHAPADLPLGVIPKYLAADYVIALPTNAMLLFYTDGITEHERDPVRGEVELAEAARRAFNRTDADEAGTIALDVLRNRAARDDVATIVLRVTTTSV